MRANAKTLNYIRERCVAVRWMRSAPEASRKLQPTQGNAEH
jgi:hypothetical protein